MRAAGASPTALEFAIQSEDEKMLALAVRRLADITRTRTATATADLDRLFHNSRAGVLLAAAVASAGVLAAWRISSRAVLQYDGERNLAIAGMRSEIVERRKAEEALFASEEKYRRIVNTAKEGIWVFGADLRVSFVNAQMGEILGYTADEMTGRLATDFLFEEDIPDHNRKMERRREGVGEHYERRLRRRDGQAVWTQVSATPIIDGEGRFQGSFAMATDVTERKRAEEELRRYRDHLASLVQERTVELKAAIEKLELSNRELDEFAYIASHDLKEPLRGIHNYVSFLQEDYADQLDEEGRSYLERMQRLAERLTALIDTLLEYSRLGSKPLTMDTVHMEGVLDTVAANLEVSLASRGVELRRPARLPAVRGNAVRLGEVFQNLIDNAAKYNDKAEKWVEVTAVRQFCREVGLDY